MPSLQDALAGVADKFTPVPQLRLAKVRPKKAAAPKKPAGKLPRRVPIETFAVAKQIPLYGEQGAHSESREPPTYDDVFPERFFAGPLYSSAKPAVPFLITKMQIGKTK
jgi:hypothetical protein